MKKILGLIGTAPLLVAGVNNLGANDIIVDGVETTLVCTSEYRHTSDTDYHRTETTYKIVERTDETSYVYLMSNYSFSGYYYPEFHDEPQHDIIDNTDGASPIGWLRHANYNTVIENKMNILYKIDFASGVLGCFQE